MEISIIIIIIISVIIEISGFSILLPLEKQPLNLVKSLLDCFSSGSNILFQNNMLFQNKISQSFQNGCFLKKRKRHDCFLVYSANKK